MLLTLLFICRHVNTLPLSQIPPFPRPLLIHALPQARNRLPLSIETDPFHNIKASTTTTPHTCHARLVPHEQGHRQRHQDGHVETNLANVEDALEVCGYRAREGEDDGVIVIEVGVDKVEGGEKSSQPQLSLGSISAQVKAAPAQNKGRN